MALDDYVEIIRTLRGLDKTEGYATTATVTRIGEDGTVFAKLDGADGDFPCAASSVTVKPGDVVDVSISNEDTHITGNRTSPSSDDSKAEQAVEMASSIRKTVSDAYDLANDAQGIAQGASQLATDAKDTAQEVHDLASEANDLAQTAKATADGVAGIASGALEAANTAAQTAATAGTNAAAAQAAAESANELATNARNRAVAAEQTINSLNVRTGEGDAESLTRIYEDGVLVGRVGQPICALVNADGSFDVVEVTWEEGTTTESHLVYDEDTGEYVDEPVQVQKMVPVVGAVVNTSGIGNVIGKAGEAQLHVDKDNMELADNNGNSVFYVGQPGDDDGWVNVETIERTGHGRIIYLTFNAERVLQIENLSASEDSEHRYFPEGSFHIDPYDKKIVVFDISLSDEWNFESARVTYVSKDKTNIYTLGKRRNQTYGSYSIAEGYSDATGTFSHSEGSYTVASGINSHAEGANCFAGGTEGHAEGRNTYASGDFSHSEGSISKATGKGSHAEGYNTKAMEYSAHAEGAHSEARGMYSHAEGFNTKAADFDAHAEGSNSEAYGKHSHAEGFATRADGMFAHAEGNRTYAIRDGAHAEGYATYAVGDYSHTEGFGTLARGEGQHVQGKWNVNDVTSPDFRPFVIGNGTDDDHRSNAFAIDWDGSIDIPDANGKANTRSNLGIDGVYYRVQNKNDTTSISGLSLTFPCLAYVVSTGELYDIDANGW